MTGLSLSDSDRLALAAAGVAEGPDGSLRSASGSIVSPGVAAALISRGDGLGKTQAQPVTSGISPGDYQRGYITAGHAADSPANRRTAQPVPPQGGDRSSSLCTTPDPDDDGAPDGGEVEKVVEPEAVDRGYLRAGHAAPSPADRPGNSVTPPVTGSGHERSEAASGAYTANEQKARLQHVEPSQCITSGPATSTWSPPADMQANAVPQPVNPGHLTGRAPGERG